MWWCSRAGTANDWRSVRDVLDDERDFRQGARTVALIPNVMNQHCLAGDSDVGGAHGIEERPMKTDDVVDAGMVVLDTAQNEGAHLSVETRPEIDHAGSISAPNEQPVERQINPDQS